jgi:glutathione S-transferase
VLGRGDGSGRSGTQRLLPLTGTIRNRSAASGYYPATRVCNYSIWVYLFDKAIPLPTLLEGKPMHSQPAGFTLYSGPLSMFGAKAQIAALEKGLEFDLVMVAYDSHLGYSPKHPEVLRINPKGQVPVLVHGGLEIFDSTQIFEYLEDLQPTPALWPRDILDRARARRLEHQSDEVYFPHIVRLMGLQTNLSDALAVSSIEAATAYYGEMEKLLTTRAWLAGSYSFADISFYMASLFGERQSAPVTAATPKLLEWRDRMTQRPAVRPVVNAMANWLRAAARPVPAFMGPPGRYEMPSD